MLGPQQVIDIERKRILHVANILRLVDEVVYEGKGGQVDTKVALRVSSLSRRVTSHACAIGYARATTRFRAPHDELGESLRALQEALHEWITHVWRLIDTTEQLGQPNSRPRRRGRHLIEKMARAPLPELDPLWRRLMAAHRASTGSVREWPPEEWEVLATELVHLTRLVTLLPELRTATAALLLPGSAEAQELKPILAQA